MVELQQVKIRKNHHGEKFGRLLLISYAGSHISDNGRTQQYYHCNCDCGNNIIVQYGSLKSGVTKTCGQCPAIKGKEHGHWKGTGDISGWIYYVYQYSAQRRGIKFQLTKEDLWKQFQSQKGLCALTGWTISFPPSYKEKGTASLDRIDSSKEYITENIQWVHKDIQKMKMDLPQHKLIELCKAIVDYSTKSGVI